MLNKIKQEIKRFSQNNNLDYKKCVNQFIEMQKQQANFDIENESFKKLFMSIVNIKTNMEQNVYFFPYELTLAVEMCLDSWDWEYENKEIKEIFERTCFEEGMIIDKDEDLWEYLKDLACFNS